MQRNSDRQFDWMLVLGFRPWRDRDLIRARAGLLSQLAERTNTLILLNLLSGAMALKAFWHDVSWSGILCFAVALTLCLVQLSRMKTAILSGLSRDRFVNAQWRLTAIGIALGLTWVVAALLFTTPANSNGQHLLYAVLICLMCATALTLSPIPLAAIAQLTVLGIGGIMLGWELKSLDMALLMLVVAGGMVASSYASGHRSLQRLYGERRLAEQNEVVRLLLKEFEDSSGDILWEIDGSKRLDRASPRFAAFFGETVEGLKDRSLLELLGGAGWETGNVPEELRGISDAIRDHQNFRNVLLPVLVGGVEHWCELSASPRYDDDGRYAGYRGVLSDVTSEQVSARKINHMARYDTLTALPNRLHMNEALNDAVLHCQNASKVCGFLMIDLDRFKAVNDTLGHPVGDRLLEQVAERLRGLLGPNDLAARLGGDEFAVLLRELRDSNYLEHLADAIIATLSKPYQVGENTLFIGASIGSAICPKDGRTADKLVRNADLALYQAKEEGRGVHRRYEPSLYAKAEQRRALEVALRETLEHGGFSLQYQPILNADDRKIVACEALLRWEHPTLGMVPPDQFIPIAEEARLISRIGEWVMRSACMEAVNWPKSVRVAVNLSVEQFMDKSLFEIIISALAHSGLEPNRLELEITESVFLKERTDVIETLERLIRIGVRISLDDFGTSYSSLGFLGRTKFSTIKIDRRYVRDAGLHTPESLAVIRAVVAMAETLGINITAEGAESDHELEMIRSLGCGQAQGYLFNRPMPAKEIRTLFLSPYARQVA